MNQYKTEVHKHDHNHCTVYRRVFLFFWTEVGYFNSYGIEASIVEQAVAFIHSKKPYYFEA